MASEVDASFDKWFGFYCLGEDPEDDSDDYDGIPPFSA